MKKRVDQKPAHREPESERQRQREEVKTNIAANCMKNEEEMQSTRKKKRRR